jgi:hypothetical protein
MYYVHQEASQVALRFAASLSGRALEAVEKVVTAAARPPGRR